MQYFAAHLRPDQQTTRSLRASQYNSRKRKRDEDEEIVEDPPTGPGNQDDAKGPPSASNTQSHASLASPATARLRVAGLLPEAPSELPPRPFPHAPARTPRDNFTYAKVQQELANLDPPLFAINASSKGRPVDRNSEAPGLRQKHLSVLTTMMHRCLLDGDYQRAGRAWGMILRTQIAGRPVDPRNNGRWGIGAEILLHRNTQNQYNYNSNDQENNRNEPPLSNEQYMYTEEGFELAREYYERLIIQHPNRKQLPNAVDDLTFYPAMFSLWMYEVCQKSKRTLQQYEESIKNSAFGSTIDEGTTTMSEDNRAHASIIHSEELRQAREIAGRLDDIVISPPFDKHTHLLRLRGMVGLWIGDLIMGKKMQREAELWELDQQDEGDEADSPQQKLQSYMGGLTAFKEAHKSLERAHANGARLAVTLRDVETGIHEITRRIAELEDEVPFSPEPDRGCHL